MSIEESRLSPCTLGSSSAALRDKLGFKRVEGKMNLAFCCVFFIAAGVPVVQHRAVPWCEEDHTLDALDPCQHLRQRGPLRAALPIHVQGPRARPGPAGGGPAEDRDALLLQRRLHGLLHGRWVAVRVRAKETDGLRPASHRRQMINWAGWVSASLPVN